MSSQMNPDHMLERLINALYLTVIWSPKNYQVVEVNWKGNEPGRVDELSIQFVGTTIVMTLRRLNPGEGIEGYISIDAEPKEFDFYSYGLPFDLENKLRAIWATARESIGDDERVYRLRKLVEVLEEKALAAMPPDKTVYDRLTSKS